MLPSLFRRVSSLSKSTRINFKSGSGRKGFHSNAGFGSKSGAYKKLAFGVFAGLTATTYVFMQNREESSFHSQTDDSAETGLSPKEFHAFRVGEITPITHNTAIYRIEFANAKAKLDLPIASFFLFRGVVNGKDVVRPYTPIEVREGSFDLIVKAYPNGNLSKHFGTLKKGDYIDVKGPLPKIQYKENMAKRIGMVAGGTGITPMFQVLTTILNNPNDNTEVSLVFANTSEGDILIKDRLDKLAAQHPNRFKVHYVVDKATSIDWQGSTGFLNKDILKKHLPRPSRDHFIFVCGPPPMMDSVCGNKAPDYTQGELKGILKFLEYTPEQVYKF